MAWEYIVRDDIVFHQADLNTLGRQGWRFVGYVGSKYVFERRSADSLPRSVGLSGFPFGFMLVILAWSFCIFMEGSKGLWPLFYRRGVRAASIGFQPL